MAVNLVLLLARLLLGAAVGSALRRALDRLPDRVGRVGGRLPAVLATLAALWAGSDAAAALWLGFLLGLAVPMDGGRPGIPDCGTADADDGVVRISCGNMGDSYEIRPFLKDNAPLAGMPARFFPHGWRRVRRRDWFPEPTVVMERGGTVVLVGKSTGLCAVVRHGDSPDPVDVVRLMGSRSVPPSRTVYEVDGTDLDGMVQVCMLRYAARCVLHGADRVNRSSHPFPAAIAFGRRFAAIRRMLGMSWLNPVPVERKWLDDIARAADAYDAVIAAHGPGAVPMRAAKWVGGLVNGIRGRN